MRWYTRDDIMTLSLVYVSHEQCGNVRCALCAVFLFFFLFLSVLCAMFLSLSILYFVYDFNIK